MAVALAAIAVVFAAGGDQLHSASAVIAIAALALYPGSFAIGLSPVFWLLISELYPVRIRGTAMSMATIAN
jgi:sugar transport protein